MNEEIKILKPNEYQCDGCKGIFEFGWSMEEAEAELKKNFGPNARKEDMAILCDGCYNKIMPTIQN